MPNEALQKIDPPVQEVNSRRSNWNDLASLVSVGESGSLREAARKSGVTVNTVRARIARLEQEHRANLIVRSASGVQLTEAGQRLFEAAREVRRARIREEDRGADVLLHPGRLTIACTEGLGTSWLTPRLCDLRERIPELTLDLQFDYDLARDRSDRADIGLTFLPPANPDLITAKLGTIHFMLFASPGYLRANGTPRNMDELRQHRFVEQVAPGYSSSGLDLLLGSDRPSTGTAVQTNSVITQVWAAVNGAGIAALPSYTRAVTSLLVPLPVLPQMRFPLSFYYRAEARGSRVISAAVEWLRGAFDAHRYPWFADEFVHPDDFPSRAYDQGNVVELYTRIANNVNGLTLTPRAAR